MIPILFFTNYFVILDLPRELFSVNQNCVGGGELYVSVCFDSFFCLFTIHYSISIAIDRWCLRLLFLRRIKQLVLSTSARHLIVVYWFGDKAKIMLIWENLRFLLFSHFMIFAIPVLLQLRFVACASRTKRIGIGIEEQAAERERETETESEEENAKHISCG